MTARFQKDLLAAENDLKHAQQILEAAKQEVDAARTRLNNAVDAKRRANMPIDWFFGEDLHSWHAQPRTRSERGEHDDADTRLLHNWSAKVRDYLHVRLAKYTPWRMHVGD